MSLPSSSVRTYNVLASKITAVVAALEALNKRAVRKGLAPLTWTTGKAFSSPTLIAVHFTALHPGEHIVARSVDGQTCEVLRTVIRVPVTLEGETPHYAGWRFVAALQHLDGENLVRALPGAECPASYRARGPQCDHCKMSRRRNDTFVLAHTEGRTIQVGSTCIRDFLGSDKADAIAASATLLADASMMLDSEERETFGGSSADRGDLASVFLSFVAWTVRVDGWISRGTARDRGGVASADIARTLMLSGKAREERGYKETADDVDLADKALAWAENLTDVEVDNAKVDYLHNVRAAARTGLVTHRTAGIVGSIIVAYQNATGRARLAADRAATPKASTYLGTIKQRLTFTARLDHVTGYETDYGYTTVLKFRTAEGALIVWKASSTDISRSDVGTTYSIKGTVTKHEDYKGEAQTIVNRCVLTKIETANAA